MSDTIAPADDFVPRDYQRQMKEICLQKNTIIYLPTGAGKTHIALMVIKEMGRVLDKPLSEGGKRTFFLVNTVALAKQQAEVIGRSVPFHTSIYTSDRNVDTWKRDRWLEEFAKYQVIVCTSQILLDVLKHGYLSIKHINLLIFDECHHAFGMHPMHSVMEEFLRVPKEDHPRVIGLSGMLLYKELKAVSQVTAELERLENTYYATIATVGSYDAYTEVCKFSTNPNEDLVYFRTAMPSAEMSRVTQAIDGFIQEKVRVLDLPKYLNQNKALQRDLPKPQKEIEKQFKDLIFQIEHLGLFGGSIALLGLIVQFELDKRESDSTLLRQMYRASITFCERLQHQLDRLMNGLNVKQKATAFSSSKVCKLIASLESLYDTSRSRTMKTLVFVQRRSSAKVLYHLLKIYFSQTEHAETIVPDFMVGNNGSMPESIEQILTAKKDRRVLERFKKNEINVIVATNVLEEGIDLQMCNAVIKFDHPMSFASYEQSKGRARMKDSVYRVMLDESKAEGFIAKYRLYKDVEIELQRCLVGKTINRPDPLDSDIYNELSKEEFPSFYTSIAKLDSLSAIQLLNRYCMGMPKDAFTNTNVIWERQDLPSGKIRVSLLLPLQSTVREKIYGNPMPNVKLAKRSAAFEACKKLYEHKEFNEHLLPIDCKQQLANLSEQYFSHWEKFTGDYNKLAGTEKSSRTHAITYPPQTMGCCPQPGQPCFIYMLRIEAGFAEDPHCENANIFRALYSSENNFGIMTTKPLPCLAKMKFYMSLGLINGRVDESPIMLPNAGTEAELAKLKRFHKMLFRDLLKVWKDFLVVDHSNGANSFLVVPMERSQRIDWALVEKFPSLSEPTELPPRARASMTMEAERYRHKVVMPWYKNDTEKAYVVTMVHEHLTPQSPFPNFDYESYKDYFVRLYHQHIVNDDQFLIEVKDITSYLNRLRPGDDDDGKSTRAKHWKFNEILIPELCHNYEFPADYWLKAAMLPSVLHRIHYLLLAENIRQDLATVVNVGCLENRSIVDVDVEYKEGKKTGALDDVEMMYEDEEDDEDDEEFNVEIAKKSLGGAEDLNALVQKQFSSIAGEVELPWVEEDEPVDIDRNWDGVSKLDLDYYDRFVKKFSDFAIREKITTQISGSYSSGVHANGSTSRGANAIMDAPPDVKFEIKLLGLTPENTAHVTVQQKDLLKALTAKCSADVFDMERDRLLGNAFLEFSVSIYLVKKYRDWHEGYLTAFKKELVGCKNLLYCAMLCRLPGMLKVHKLDPRNDWEPPMATVPHKVKQTMAPVHHPASVLYKLSLSEQEVNTGVIEESNYENFITELDLNNQSQNNSPMQGYLSQQGMNDQVPADAMQALMGVCVKSVGIKRSFRLLSYFGVLPNNENLLTLLDEQIENQRVGNGASSHEVDAFLWYPGPISRILGYTFRDRTYLLQALTHASYPNNRVTGSYQQLQFVGHAVMDFLITSYIFEHNKTMNPDQLVDLRLALTNNVTLACLLVRYNLHIYILSESAALTDTIGKFVAYQEQHKHQVTDQVNLLVEESERAMAEFIDVPKALGDVFEALIGAVFLDSGNNLPTTWKVIYGLMHQEIVAFEANTPIQIVRQLHEWKPPCDPKFSRAITDDGTVLVKLRYQIRNQQHEAYGFGQNKGEAERAAAKVALQLLRRQ